MMKTWEEIPGWFDFQTLYNRAVAEVPFGGQLVEVGNYVGRSLCYLGLKVQQANKRQWVFGVDHGLGSPEPPAHSSMLARPGQKTVLPTPPMDPEEPERAGPEVPFTAELVRNVYACGLWDLTTLIAAPSVRASELFPDESLDFVFLDADHQLASVQADLTVWAPKIRPGGILAGHDYSPFPSDPSMAWRCVRQAVDQFFHGHSDMQAVEPVTCWGVRKVGSGQWSKWR